MSAQQRPNDKLLTLEEVCEFLKVKRSWGYNDKTLPWIKVGRYKRLWQSDLDRYLEGQRRRVSDTTSIFIMRHSQPIPMLDE